MLFYSSVVTGSKWRRREGGVAFGCNITDVSADTRRRRVGPLELRWQRKKEQGIGWRLDYDEHLDAKRTLGTRDGETRRWLVFHLFICCLASTAHFEKQILLSSGSHPTQLRFEAASSARSWGRERSVIRPGIICMCTEPVLALLSMLRDHKWALWRCIQSRPSKNRRADCFRTWRKAHRTSLVLAQKRLHSTQQSMKFERGSAHLTSFRECSRCCCLRADCEIAAMGGGTKPSWVAQE